MAQGEAAGQRRPRRPAPIGDACGPLAARKAQKVLGRGQGAAGGAGIPLRRVLGGRATNFALVFTRGGLRGPADGALAWRI